LASLTVYCRPVSESTYMTAEVMASTSPPGFVPVYVTGPRLYGRGTHRMMAMPRMRTVNRLPPNVILVPGQALRSSAGFGGGEMFEGFPTDARGRKHRSPVGVGSINSPRTMVV
jgi:hypothetical protein